VPSLDVVLELLSLLGGQAPVLVPLGKLAHSDLVLLLEPKLEDIVGQFSGEIRLVGLDQSSKDLDLAGIVLGSLDRSHEFDSSCSVP